MIKKFVDKSVELNWSKIEEIRNIKSSCCIDSKVKVFDVDEFLENFSRHHKFKTDSSVDCVLLRMENGNYVYDLIEMKNWQLVKEHYKKGFCENKKCKLDRTNGCPDESCLTERLKAKLEEFLSELNQKFHGTIHTFDSCCNITSFNFSNKDICDFRNSLNKNMGDFIFLSNHDPSERLSMTLKFLSLSLNYYNLEKTPYLMDESQFTEKFESNQIY